MQGMHGIGRYSGTSTKMEAPLCKGEARAYICPCHILQGGECTSNPWCSMPAYEDRNAKDPCLRHICS